MANSKANIYPIQLQGAELCLNKYDAEIKQYSGFNKNNSPFVGGCLSNVFTKEENRTNLSVFIAPNGDKYEVVDSYSEGHGLKKNGRFVIKYNNTKYIAPPSNRDYTPDNYKYADRKFTYAYYLKMVPDGSNNTLKFVYRKSSSSSLFQATDIETFTGQYVLDNLLYNSPAFIIRPGDTWRTDYAIFAYYHGHTKKIILHRDNINAVVVTDSTSATIDETYPISIMYDDNSSQVSIAYRTTDGNQFLDFYTLDTDSITLIAHEVSTINNTTSYVMPALDAFSFANYPACTGNLYKVGNDTFAANKLIGWVQYPYYDNSKINFRNTYRLNTPNIVETKECTLFNESKTNFLSCYDMTIPVKTSSGDTSYKSLCVHFNSLGLPRFDGFNLEDFTDKNGIAIKKCTFVLGEQLPFTDDVNGLYANFNNNQLSAICTKNVLITNWNVADMRSIVYDGSDSAYSIDYYENNKLMECGFTSSLSFSVKGNQIVLYADDINNAYDFVNNKVLHFAPSYNNSLLLYETESGTNLYTATSNNNVWVASAINEYKLQDNASIILNPVNVFTENLNGMVIKTNSYTSGKVNIYKGTLPSKTDYLYSIENELKQIDQTLIELPFPVDTNGNVTLSPSISAEVATVFGNNVLITIGSKGYPLIINNDTRAVFSFYIGSEVENLKELFILQGQSYGLIDNGIYSLSWNNGVISNLQFIVSVEGMQYCGQSPYQAIFFSPTNRYLYSFTGVNILQKMQSIDKVTEIYSYEYNKATQTNMLFTDAGAIFISAFGMYSLDYRVYKSFILNNGICLLVKGTPGYDLLYIKYYLGSNDTGYTKENIRLETSFYGMNNQTVTINDCLYMRIFSEEHEEGSLKVSATTISLQGRKTEETTFKIKASDWDAITHTIYLRYQPKEQRGLGVSFSIDSPFKIASLSVGSQADAILVDKVSKGAINAPQINSNDDEW